ncbi:glycosyltransferase [Pseudanabaena biceps]|nr:glycosyltransferase [Pseudanabaena biceps]
MKPLVSIIIPCYNAESWLLKAINSVLAQTWQKTEIIVVDDGSTDNSLGIAKQVKSSKIKVISQINQGASSARNRALVQAQGDFIQYLDADDLLGLDKIERQLKILEYDTSSSYIASGEWGRFYRTPSEASFIAQSLWTDMSPVEWFICSWEYDLMMHPATWLVPRSIVELSGNWNESLSLNDDGEYFCRVILASKGVRFCQGAKSYYRSGNPLSLSASYSRQAWESALLALELCTANLITHEDSKHTRHACATVLQRFVHTVYPDYPDLLQKASNLVSYFGGTNLRLEGSPTIKFVEHYTGWKTAKLLQKMWGIILNRKK